MSFSTISGAAADQGISAAAAQIASGIAASAAASTGGSPTEAAQVAVLHKALEAERSSVNILA